MKGIIFTEFIDMVEEHFGYEMVDYLIESSNLPSGGSYTSVGTYNYSEIMQLVRQLHLKTKIPLDDLLRTFGIHLHKTFTTGYHHFFEAYDSSREFLESIDNHIHVEVRKLYPDAELPSFETSRPNEKTLEMLYTSERKMGQLALGLIEKSVEFYNEKAEVTMENLSEDGTQVRFVIKYIQ